MPILEKACYCVKLQDGTIVLGLVGCSYFIWSLVSLLIDLKAGEIYFSDWHFLVILIQAVNFAVSVNIIRAGYTENRDLLEVGLLIFMVELICYNIYLYRLTLGDKWELVLLIFVATNAILIYTWLIMFSYYHELEDQRKIKIRNSKEDV